MVEFMNIHNYLSYFHDGALIDINYTLDEIIFSLESGEIDPSDLKDALKLSDRNTLKGKLHLKDIIFIYMNENQYFDLLQMKYDSATIFELIIDENVVEISLIWENFPPKEYVNDFDTIKIAAKEISWENIPDLFDPFW